MKRFLVILAALIISVSAFSQSYKNAIGVKLGYDMALTYKTNLSEANFLDFSVDFSFFHKGYFGVTAGGFYNWNFVVADGLSLYVGPGVYLGVGLSDNSAAFYASINAMLGIEYKFANAPIAISLDYTPGLRICPNIGYSGYAGGLGVKYTF